MEYILQVPYVESGYCYITVNGDTLEDAIILLNTNPYIYDHENHSTQSIKYDHTAATPC